MATATFVQSGDRIDYTPSAAVAAGDIVVYGNCVFVADRAIAADEKGSLATSGVFSFPKASGGSTAIAKGVLVYWDAGNSVITTTASSNKKIGVTTAASVDGDTTQPVMLQPLG